MVGLLLNQVRSHLPQITQSCKLDLVSLIRTLPKLSISDCLKIAEAALAVIHQEQSSLTKDEQKRALAAAAKTAVPDYAAGSQLIAFSEIEGEDFYDYRDTKI